MRSRSKREGWLLHTLKGRDSMDGKRLKELASDSGIKERTLYRAAQAISVTMLPGGFGKPRRWHLSHVCQRMPRVPYKNQRTCGAGGIGID
jgi:hypothetical protein